MKSLSRICCKPWLAANQLVADQESQVLQFKGYQLEHINRQKSLILLKTICSMLNCKPGRIILGVNEERPKCQRRAIGVQMCAGQDVLFFEFISQISQLFHPKLRLGHQISVNFIPVVSSKGESKALIKLTIRGAPNTLYTFSFDSIALQAFIREDIETKALRSMSEKYSQILSRIGKSEKLQELDHICPEPMQFIMIKSRARMVKLLSMQVGVQNCNLAENVAPEDLQSLRLSNLPKPIKIHQDKKDQLNLCVAINQQQASLLIFALKKTFPQATHQAFFVVSKIGLQVRGPSALINKMMKMLRQGGLNKISDRIGVKPEIWLEN